jgi:hypothetical protein
VFRSSVCVIAIALSLTLPDSAAADECVHIDGAAAVECIRHSCTEIGDGLWACGDGDAVWITDCPSCADVDDSGVVLAKDPVCRFVACPKLPVDVPGICCETDKECCEFVIAAPSGWDPRWKGYCYWDRGTQWCLNEKETCSWTPKTGALHCAPTVPVSAGHEELSVEGDG